MVQCSKCNYYEHSGSDKNRGACHSPGVMVHKVTNPYRPRKCKRFALTQEKFWR